MPVGHLHLLFGKMSIQFFCPFFNQIVSFFDVKLYELFIYVGYLLLIGHIICKYLLPFSRLSFHFVSGFLCCAKFLSLIMSHLFIFAFVSFALGDGSKKILLQFMSKGVLPMFSSRSFIISGLTF